MGNINPGNERTVTLRESVWWEVLDAIDDRIEELTENIGATDLHTKREIADFQEMADALREARAEINGAES